MQPPSPVGMFHVKQAWIVSDLNGVARVAVVATFTQVRQGPRCPNRGWGAGRWTPHAMGGGIPCRPPARHCST